MKKNTTLWIGIVLLLGLLFVMYVAPYLPFVDRALTPEKHRFTNIEGKRLMLPPYPPSAINPLGSDENGVDNLSKLVMGAKDTVYLVLIVTLVRYLLAVPLGLLAYRQKGILHYTINGLNHVFMNIPTIISAVLLLSLPSFMSTPHRFWWGVFFIALIEVGRVAYIVQQQAFQVAQEPFLEAGTILGLSKYRLLRKYYLPALLPEVVVNFCVDIGKVMLLIGQLGILSVFLNHELMDVTGFGTYEYVNVGLDWFTLLSEHRMDIYFERFAFIFAPAIGIMYVILTFNVLGEGLRRHFHRHMHTYM